MVCPGGKKNIRERCARCRPIVYSATAAIFHQVVSYVLFPRFSSTDIPRPRQERGRVSIGFRSRWTDLLLPAKELTFHRRESLPPSLLPAQRRSRFTCARVNRHYEATETSLAKIEPAMWIADPFPSTPMWAT